MAFARGDSSLARRVRDWFPSWDQWLIASVCVGAAALVGFGMGRVKSLASMHVAAAPASSAACITPMDRPRPPVDQRASDHPSARALDSFEPVSVEPVRVPKNGPSAADMAAAEQAEQATRKAIARAMAGAATRAAICRADTSPPGIARVSVTFLPTGEVKTATVRGAPFAGTVEGQCIADKFRSLRVPSFSGEGADNVTVRKVVTLD
jgi:hypothetical protein